MKQKRLINSLLFILFFGYQQQNYCLEKKLSNNKKACLNHEMLDYTKDLFLEFCKGFCLGSTIGFIFFLKIINNNEIN